jgi:DNA-binding transcriptional LysR family regulator
MIEVNLLRYAQAAAETGSFSQAAGRFGIKQTTLSQSIQYLEARLGLALFTRSTRGVSVTLPGTKILDRARQIILDIDGLLEESQAIASGHVGRLRIGFNGSLANGTLADTVRSFRAAYPGITVEAREADRRDLLLAVERGTLDVALAPRSARHQHLEMIGLWCEPLIATLGPDHPYRERRTLSWADLRDDRLIVSERDPGPDIAAIIRARMAALNIEPSICRQAVSNDHLVAFTSGDQVAVTCGRPFAARTPVIAKEIHDAFGPSTIEQCLYWKCAPPSPPLGSFLELAAVHHGKHPEPGTPRCADQLLDTIRASSV